MFAELHTTIRKCLQGCDYMWNTNVCATAVQAMFAARHPLATIVLSTVLVATGVQQVPRPFAHSC